SYCSRHHRPLRSFPTRRSSDLKSLGWEVEGQEVDPLAHQAASSRGLQVHLGELTTLNLRSGHYDAIVLNHVIEHLSDASAILLEDRKSTRLNSSHVKISYAVFC